MNRMSPILLLISVCVLAVACQEAARTSQPAPSANSGYQGKGVPRPDVLGVYDPKSGAFFLGDHVSAFSFAAPGMVPLAGDWDGDGVETIGVQDAEHAVYFFRNSLDSGVGDVTFNYGFPGTLAITGDWNGDGIDTIAIYRPGDGTFFLSDVNAAGPALYTFSFGPVNGVPIAGDWDGDGRDSVGVYVPDTATFFLVADDRATQLASFGFGAPNLIPIAGDWDGDGKDSIGVYDPASGVFNLRNALTSGSADVTKAYGAPDHLPIIGRWP